MYDYRQFFISNFLLFNCYQVVNDDVINKY